MCSVLFVLARTFPSLFGGAVQVREALPSRSPAALLRGRVFLVLFVLNAVLK